MWGWLPATRQLASIIKHGEIIVRLTPQEPEIPEDRGFTTENDIFGYLDFAERLANLVSNID